MKAELHIQTHYFNEKLSVWEPLVEPVTEKEGVYRPWEVVIKVIIVIREFFLNFFIKNFPLLKF